jgi:hypothetical protein
MNHSFDEFAGRSLPTFQRNILRFVCIVACLVYKYSLTLKMEAVCPSEILVNIYYTAWHHIPEDSSLHGHHNKLSGSHKRLEASAEGLSSKGLLNIIIDLCIIIVISYRNLTT